MLPRFDSDQGVEWLLAAAGTIELTAMPVDLVATGANVTLSAARNAMALTDFEGDISLQIRTQQPGGTKELQPTIRDPYESWVMLGMHVDGRIDVTRGGHAIQVVE